MLRRLFILLNLAIVAVSSSHSVLAQGTFNDLNFEEANPSLIQPNDSAPALFPGWQLLYGNSQSFIATYDAVTLAAANIGIMDDNGPLVPFQGNYMAILQSGSSPTMSLSVSLVQTAILPSGDEWIEFEANQSEGAAFSVTMNGDALTMFPVENTSRYTVYAGNISSWAGQIATLSITEMPPSNPQYSSLLQLDDIMFSQTAVTPEPDPVALMGIGGLLFALYRRFTPKG